MSDPFADGWPDADLNARACYDLAIEELRRLKREADKVIAEETAALDDETETGVS